MPRVRTPTSARRGGDTRRAASRQPAGPPAGAVRPAPGGVGRSSSAAAEAVSDALRRGDSPFLTRRRRIGALSLGAMGSLGAVAAYQLGLIKHLPEPPGRWFDADRVDASGEAYTYLKTPDAALGLLSYAATLVLAGMRADRHPASQPFLSLAFGAKVASDAAGGMYLTLEQATKHRRFCSWCLGATAFSLAMVPQVVPEVRAAWRGLRAR